MGESDHSGAGDSDAHGIFEDIGAQPTEIRSGSAPRVSAAGHAERHGDGLGAPDGGDDLPLNQIDDLFTFRNGQHTFGI